MSKFNKAQATTAGPVSVISSTPARGQTYEGATGYGRDLKSELFLLAVQNLVGEKAFYETAETRDTRFTHLVRAVAVSDVVTGADWLTKFVHWLRYEANMRTASIVAAAEGTKALLDADMPGGRKLIAGSMRRADEPGEFLAYWRSNIDSDRPFPKPVKRGVSEAVWRLYTEDAVIRYDTASKAFRFADVIEMVRPTGSLQDKASMPIKGTWRADLYTWLIDRRHGREVSIPASLRILRKNAELRAAALKDPLVLLDPVAVSDAGMTWENVLSMVGDRIPKADLWTALIPSMGYMALLRNLRNFDQAGVPDSVAKHVAEWLADPEQVANSRQFPMRFLSAYRAAPSLRWSYPLEQAIGHSLANVPELPGSTLILVDTSSSMYEPFSKDGTVMRWDVATLFGIALAHRCEVAEVVSFSSKQRFYGDPAGTNTKVFPLVPGESLLRSVERWKIDGYFLGGGTETAGTVRKHYQFHDRVVILTDEQANKNRLEVSKALPASVPLYTFNLAGYRLGHSESGIPNRHTFGGLSDAAFRMIPWLDRKGKGVWPWEVEKAAVAA